MCYYCVIMLLTCSFAHRQPMETWRLRWCVSSGGVTSPATLILWLTVMQVSRKMHKERARTHRHHLRADCRAVPKYTTADQPRLHALYIPRPLLSCIDLSVAKIGHASLLPFEKPHWDDLSVFQESSRRSLNSRRSPKNKNTSSNTENSSCLDSSNLYLPLTSGTY